MNKKKRQKHAAKCILMKTLNRLFLGVPYNLTIGIMAVKSHSRITNCPYLFIYLINYCDRTTVAFSTRLSPPTTCSWLQLCGAFCRNA